MVFRETKSSSPKYEERTASSRLFFPTSLRRVSSLLCTDSATQTGCSKCWLSWRKTWEEEEDSESSAIFLVPSRISCLSHWKSRCRAHAADIYQVLNEIICPFPRRTLWTDDVVRSCLIQGSNMFPQGSPPCLLHLKDSLMFHGSVNFCLFFCFVCLLQCKFDIFRSEIYAVAMGNYCQLHFHRTFESPQWVSGVRYDPG